MSITHITSLSQLNGILSKSKDKLSVIDFHATWCGPCHAIAPKFESLAKSYPNVNFLKCDVDAAQEVASNYQVTAMPTFVFLKGSTKVDQVRGANARALEAAIEKHASGSSGSVPFSGKGHTLGGSSSSSPSGSGSSAGASGSGEGGLNPQVKVLLGLIGLYVLFWYLG